MLTPSWIGHYRALADQTFVVVDVETTGCNAQLDRVIEVSVLRASLAQGIEHQETTLIDAGVLVPAAIARFTGITNAMLLGAPPPERVWPRLSPLLAEGVFVAHNLRFDLGFLQAEYGRLSAEYQPQQHLCTVQLARHLLADLPSRSLPHLVQHFGFNVGPAHRAEADARACWLLLEHLLTDLLGHSEADIQVRLGQEWLSLSAIARMLSCSRQQAQKRLLDAGYQPVLSESRGVPRYRRAWVEAVMVEP
jgi:DNA polymerase-3 subunit epsilon